VGIGPVVAVIGLMIQLSRGGGKPAAPAAVNSAPPPVVPVVSAAATLNAIKTPDSATIAQASKTPPKTGPSERAAAIIAYNKLKSSCPKRDTLLTSKPIDYAVRVDTMRDRTLSNKMDIGYDVCGLPSSSAFTTFFTLTKLNQRGFGKQAPHLETAVGNVGSPRSHQREALDTHEMSAGSYRLDVLVKDGRKRQVTASREFKITDK
jgi:hypothetical protein